MVGRPLLEPQAIVDQVTEESTFLSDKANKGSNLITIDQS